MDEFDYLLMLEDAEEIKESDLDKLELLSIHKDNEIRNRTAMVLGFINNDRSERILINLINDKDYLIRANACDSLSCSNNTKIIPLLFKCINDTSELVRGYAVSSIVDIVMNSGIHSTEIIEKLEMKMTREKKEWVLLSYYRALYLLGEEKFLSVLMKALSSNNYKVQIAASNILKELKTVINYVKINNALSERLDKEDPPSVKHAIKTALQNNFDKIE